MARAACANGRGELRRARRCSSSRRAPVHRGFTRRLPMSHRCPPDPAVGGIRPRARDARTILRRPILRFAIDEFVAQASWARGDRHRRSAYPEADDSLLLAAGAALTQAVLAKLQPSAVFPRAPCGWARHAGWAMAEAGEFTDHHDRGIVDFVRIISTRISHCASIPYSKRTGRVNSSPSRVTALILPPYSGRGCPGAGLEASTCYADQSVPLVPVSNAGTVPAIFCTDLRRRGSLPAK